MRTLVSKTYRGSACGVGLVVIIVEQSLQLIFSKPAPLRPLTDEVHQFPERQGGLGRVHQMQAHQGV